LEEQSLMIRAVLKNGILQPLDPPPAAWSDGRELRVEEAEPSADDLDQWYRDLDALVGRLDPGDHPRLEAALRNADEQAKALVRRQMGLD
jgi:hypothetical protein